MRAVLLVLGLCLVGPNGEVRAQPGAAPAQGVRPVVAPEPLPQLSATGLPDLPAPPPLAVPGKEGGLAPAAPVTRPPRLVPKGLPAAPAPAPKEIEPKRPPAFKLVNPASGEQMTPTPQDRPIPPPRPLVPADQFVLPAEPTALPPATEGPVQIPTLVLDKIAPPTVVPGQPFAYEIVVRNTGSVPAQQVRVEDELRTGTRVLAALPTAKLHPDRLVWTIDGLQPGWEQRLRVEAVAAAAEWGGSATLTVSVARALRPPPTAANGGLAVKVNAPPAATVGHPVPFEIRVTNNGRLPLGRVLVHDRLPPGLEHALGGDVETTLDGLGPGETRVLRLELIAARLGRHANEVTVRADGGGQAVAHAAVTVAEDPLLTVRLVGPREAPANREIEYRIEVSNRAAPGARSVTVACQLPDNVAIVSGIASGSYDPVTRTARWTLGAIEPGQSQSLPLKLLARAGGAGVARIAVRTAQGHDAVLHALLRFAAPGLPGAGAARGN